MFEGIEVFEAIASGEHAMDQALSGHAGSQLKDQSALITEGQLDQLESLKSELLTELGQANKIIDACRTKIKGSHDKLSAKSCLKHQLNAYLDKMKPVQLESLEKLLVTDLHICKQSLDKASELTEKFKQDYAKFLAKQQKQLQKFLESS